MTKNYSRKRQWLAFALFSLMLIPLNSFSQTYFPRATGNWNAANSWSTASCVGTAGTTIPSTTANAVSMSCSGKTITVGSTANAGALTISSGTLIVNSALSVTSLTMTGGTLTLNAALNVTGDVSISAGSVINGNTSGVLGLIGTTQNITSAVPITTLNVAGSGNKTMNSSITISDELKLTTNNLIVANNTLTVGNSSAGSGITRTNGKMTLAAGSSLSFGGSWTQNDLSTLISNTFPLTINNFTMTRNLCTVGLGSAHNLTVTGAFTLTAGDFLIGASTLTLNGAISGNIFGSIKGGSTSDLTIGGSGAASMYFDLASAETVGGSNTIRNFTNNRTSNPFTMLSSMRIGGTLTQAANASLQITSGSIQTLSLDGSVSGTSKIVGNSGAILQINGSGSLGGTLVFSSTPTLANLTMNRTGGTATIGTAISVGGISFKKGVLTNDFLTTVTGSAPNNVAQELSSSYLNGALARTIAANTNAAAYIWPVGKSASQKLTFNGITTGSDANPVIKVEAFDADSNGTADVTISNLKTDNYWSASVTSNASNLTAVGLVTVNDTGLLATDAIGYATTASGQYTSLGGTIAAGAITSTTDAPVALGFYNLGTAESVCTEATLATINASSSTNCGTVATTLSIASGALNSAANWVWYSGSCGGVAAGTGSSIIVSPTVTTTYYVRGEGGCVTPGACSNITITVNTPQLYYADADGDSYGNPAVSQSACIQPIGYVLDHTDCNDDDNAIHETFSFYADADGDTFGAGNLVAVCAVNANTPPQGYVNNNTDCDDNNANIHQTYSFYADTDGDGYGAGDAVSVCAINANTPPTGYVLNNTDCNDNNNAVYQSAALYVDADLDGYSSGVTQIVCYGASIPSGFLSAPTLIDCNDSVAAINPGHAEMLYNGVDDNCDGNLDEGFQIKTQLVANSCGATLSALGSLIQIQTLAPASAYTGWRIRATNGAQVQIIEKSVPHFTMTEFPSYAYATTYTIEIQLQRNGVWLGYYGTSCLVSTPAIVETGGGAINPSQCGATLTQINTVIATTSVQGVTGYRFRVTNLTDPIGPNPVQTIDRVQNWFTLQMLTRYNYGTTYRIEVAVKTTGTYGPFGTTCEISSPAVPSLTICGGTVASGTTLVKTASIAGATQYRFQITRQFDVATATLDRSTNYFTFNMLPPATFTAGAVYNVRVAVMTNGTWSPYGDVCEITAPGGASKGTIDNTDAKEPAADFKAAVFPNPFTAYFNIDVATPGQGNVQLKVYDMLGKLVESKEVKASDIGIEKVGAQYPSGVYNVILSQDGFVKTLRVIKR